MLGRFSEFLFGSSTADEVAVDQTQASQPLNLNMSDGDMGWVVVDVSGCSSKTQSELEKGDASQQPRACLCTTSCSCTLVELEKENALESDCEGPSNIQDLVLYERSSFGPRLHSLLGESWIVTPPPCFTGTGSVTELSSSPLENLLIEHPSMSVYHHTKQNSLDREEPVQKVREEQQQTEKGVQQHQVCIRRIDGARHRRVVLSDNRHPPRPIRACAGAVQQMKLICYQQRQEQAVQNKEMSKSCLERGNKVCMVQSSCRRQVSARNRLLRPSGCMNGRRSQRAH